VLDDAFQHRQVHRDLDIVLLDAQRPFGNGLLQPAGLLREPSTALCRADLVILTRMTDGITLPILDVDMLCSRHVLDRSGTSLNGERIDFADLTGKRVFAFAGIAEPESFFAGLNAAGVELCGCLGFPDHAVYDTPQLELLLRTAAAAEIFLTTEKDAVKLDFSDFDRPCYAVGVALEFEDDTFLQLRIDQLWAKNF
jgi:tetraacyldisaccharide 4'-kinase